MKANFEKFCTNINRFTNLSYVWNTIRILKNARKNIQWNCWLRIEKRRLGDLLIILPPPPFVGSDSALELDNHHLDLSLDALFQRSELGQSHQYDQEKFSLGP